MKFIFNIILLFGVNFSYAIVNGSPGSISNHPLGVIGIDADGRCTATKVGENLFLTARHCLLSSKVELNDETPLILLGSYREQKITIAQNIEGSNSNFKINADIKEIFLNSVGKLPAWEKGSIYLDNNSERIVNDVAFFSLQVDNEYLDKLPISEFDFDFVEKGNKILIAGYGKTECSNLNYLYFPYNIKVAKQRVEKSGKGVFSSTGSKTKAYITKGDSGAAVFRFSTDEHNSQPKIIGLVSSSHSGKYIPLIQSYKGQCFPQGAYADLTKQEDFIRDVLEKRIEPVIIFGKDI